MATINADILEISIVNDSKIGAFTDLVFTDSDLTFYSPQFTVSDFTDFDGLHTDDAYSALAIFVPSQEESESITESSDGLRITYSDINEDNTIIDQIDRVAIVISNSEEILTAIEEEDYITKFAVSIDETSSLIDSEENVLNAFGEVGDSESLIDASDCVLIAVVNDVENETIIDQLENLISFVVYQDAINHIQEVSDAIILTQVEENITALDDCDRVNIVADIVVDIETLIDDSLVVIADSVSDIESLTDSTDGEGLLNSDVEETLNIQELYTNILEVNIVEDNPVQDEAIEATITGIGIIESASAQDLVSNILQATRIEFRSAQEGCSGGTIYIPKEVEESISSVDQSDSGILYPASNVDESSIATEESDAVWIYQVGAAESATPTDSQEFVIADIVEDVETLIDEEDIIGYTTFGGQQENETIIEDNTCIFTGLADQEEVNNAEDTPHLIATILVDVEESNIVIDETALVYEDSVAESETITDSPERAIITSSIANDLEVISETQDRTILTSATRQDLVSPIDVIYRIMTVPVSTSEMISLIDYVSNIIIRAVDGQESTLSVDTILAVSNRVASIVETATILDLVSCTYKGYNRLNEIANAQDVIDGNTIEPKLQKETANATSTQTVLAIFAPQRIESTVAQSRTSSVKITVADITEAGNAIDIIDKGVVQSSVAEEIPSTSDTSNATLFARSQTVESTTPADISSFLTKYTKKIIEIVSANDFAVSNFISNKSVRDINRLIDTISNTAILNVDVSEIAEALDYLGNLFEADVAEIVNAQDIERLLYKKPYGADVNLDSKYKVKRIMLEDTNNIEDNVIEKYNVEVELSGKKSKSGVRRKYQETVEVL